jgi:UPF0148 protein
LPQQKTKEENHIKQMANLLRQGSALTNLACPACSSPLFKLKNGDIWCAKCQKKVIILKEGEEPTKITTNITLNTLETTLLTKIQQIQTKIQHEKRTEELQKLSTTLTELLENLEKIKQIKKT